MIVEYEPAGAESEGRHLFRLWFLARNSTYDRVSIGLLQGQLNSDQARDGLLPVFTSFGANPVLTDEPGTFAGCADCLIHGLSVVRVPDTETIRFLIARQDNAGVAEDWHYAPFEQFWRSPWRTTP